MTSSTSEYVLTDEFPSVPMSSIDCWSDGGEYEDSDDYDEDDEDDQDDEEYDYDKDGRRRWKKKKAKDKGDDPSKAIKWTKLYPNFEYDDFNKYQESLPEECDGPSGHTWINDGVHTTARARAIFTELFGRLPGDHTDWAYVRTVADCDYYCGKLLESSVLPGVIGVDVEMENDRVPFCNWPSKWRTIRAHSRLAKGMFARLLQASNCDGLVVLFDLYALARPHSWEGGIEMKTKSKHWKHPSEPLPTSTLPSSLVHFILDPAIVRFGWALHCDWSSLYNSFGLVVPQKSYLDAQTMWRLDLRPKVKGGGNGLADAAAALFDVTLDKSVRGYGHFWHGMAPYGKIPKFMLSYAIKDAQVSLDVALMVLVMTNWLRDLDGIWYSMNVESVPMPGVRKRICAWFGIDEETTSTSQFERRSIDNDEQCHRTDSEGSDSGMGKGEATTTTTPEEGSDDQTEEVEAEMELEEVAEVAIDPEQEDDQSEIEEGREPMEEDRRVVVVRDDRIVLKDTQTYQDIESSSTFSAFIKPKPRDVRKQEDLVWKQLPTSARQYIKTCKGEAYKVFDELPVANNEKGKKTDESTSSWSWCPQMAVLRASMRRRLKRLILDDEEVGGKLKRIRRLYRNARVLLDNNLEWAWRQAFHRTDSASPSKSSLAESRRPTPWTSFRTFQTELLEKSSIARARVIDQKRFSSSRNDDDQRTEKKRKRTSTTVCLGRRVVPCALEDMLLTSLDA